MPGIEAAHIYSDSATRKLRRVEIEEALVRAQEVQSTESIDLDLYGVLKDEAEWLRQHPDP